MYVPKMRQSKGEEEPRREELQESMEAKRESRAERVGRAWMKMKMWNGMMKVSRYVTRF